MLLNISFHYDFYPLFVVAAIALITPILLSLLKFKKIQIVIIEIISGFLAGKFLFGNLSEDSFLILDFLALSGFLFLMFLSGLEIDVDQIIASLPRRKLTISHFLKNPLLVELFLLARFPFSFYTLLHLLVELGKYNSNKLIKKNPCINIFSARCRPDDWECLLE